MPVGWNCTNSMSTSSAPAKRAMACPSAVYSHELEVIFHALPIPPVARTTALAEKTTNLPVSRQYPRAPHTRSPSLRRIWMVHSMKTSMPLWTACCWRVRIISRPVRSPTWPRRA